MFNSCTNLESVNIFEAFPNAKEFGASAFENCYRLKSVHITDLSAWCNISFKLFANPLFFAHDLYLEGNLITDLVIPDGVTKIGDYAFGNCSRLESITIPNSVTSIGSFAFSRCNNLTSLEIPNSVTNIDMYAFSYCANLTSVTIPTSVKNVSKTAFKKCHKKLTIMLKTQDGECITLPMKKHLKKYLKKYAQ
jgi:hypothetical protein